MSILQREDAAVVGQSRMPDLQPFISKKVKISILDKDGEEQAPFVLKMIQKVAPCPDNTHLRIYFDHRTFLAVPLTSKISQNEDEWSAYDQQMDLQYVIRKVSDFHD